MELRIVPVIRFVTLVAAVKLSAVSCVPMKHDVGYRNSVDLDTEQTEARYDQGMLADIINDERPEMQKAESCMADNSKYDHGQKIQRFDPCEVCLCIDGEIFCWWKQCDIPSKSDLNESPLDGYVQLSTPVAPYHSQPPATDVAVASSSTTKSPLLRAINDTTTPSSPTAAPPPYLDQSDNVNVRIAHPQPPPDNIPQNILSFPQSPPIMMYRPPLGGKNATSAAVASSAAERNKYGGPLKKVKPLHLVNGAAAANGKKPYRKSKSKGYVINYGRIEDRGLAAAADAGRRTPLLAVTERMPSDGMRILNDDAGRAFQSGDDDDDDDEDEDESGNDDDEDDDESREPEGHRDSKAVGNSGENFGGFGYGMIKEPDDDKQQHYIITSSGHVEMFDDNSMEATENAFGMNRLPSKQHQLQPLGSSTTIQPMALVLGGSLDDEDQFDSNQATSSSSSREGDSELDDPSNRGGSIPPLIQLITNVTQHSNYSVRFTAANAGGGSPPLTPYSPPLPPSRSVIDVLNSTTVDGDYQDDNQTELIYPAVPGLTGGSSSGSSVNYRRINGVRGVDVGGSLVKAITATMTTTTSSVTPEASSTPELHCVVMGVSYKVGAVLKQEAGNCLHCVCVAGPESEPVPRVTCTPLNCPPLILPDILDGAGF